MQFERDVELANAIRNKDIKRIYELMFRSTTPPTVNIGFRTESELWDYKGTAPKPGKSDEIAWAEIAKDVLAFHNQKGGVLAFGVDDKTFLYCGVAAKKGRLDSKLFNDQIRRYVGDKIWVEFQRQYIHDDQSYLGLAIIPPRGPAISRFTNDSPKVDGKVFFEKDDAAIRDGDSSKVLRKAEADILELQLVAPSEGGKYAVDLPLYRIINKDYEEFVSREKLCTEVEQALKDKRTSVASLVGIGGAGKTALATWATLRAYARGDFNFIVSITAKDRELSNAGIRALEPGLTSFECLLDVILDVLGFPEEKRLDAVKKESAVRSLIENSAGLIYVDNLETVDDSRIISFLDTLPQGVKALTTSRRTSVRVSVFPVDVGPLTDKESQALLKSYAKMPGFGYLTDLSDEQRDRLIDSCGRVPLAIRWAVSRSESKAEVLNIADSIRVSGRQGEELLEFCFRRVFEAMSLLEKEALQVLSIFQKPLPLEIMVAATGQQPYMVNDTLEVLSEDALVQRFFDKDRNDYSYTLHPIVRAFVYSQLDAAHENRIRTKLQDWYEAKDIKDPAERLAVREYRQGKTSSELPLLDLAKSAAIKHDPNADRLFENALQRNPKSSKVAYEYALYKKARGHISDSLRLFEQASANVPTEAKDDCASIYKYWGMALKDAGDDDSTDRAIEVFEKALTCKADVAVTHALATMHYRKGFYEKAIVLLEPIKNHPNQNTRKKARSVLAQAYRKSGDTINAAILEDE